VRGRRGKDEEATPQLGGLGWEALLRKGTLCQGETKRGIRSWILYTHTKRLSLLHFSRTPRLRRVKKPFLLPTRLYSKLTCWGAGTGARKALAPTRADSATSVVTVRMV
jgi:hypothetical protein